MFGVYETFPENVHRTAFFTSSISQKRLQRTLTETLHRLNIEEMNLENLGNVSIPECQIAFEFGIAENLTFNYLDDEEKRKLLSRTHKEPFRIMDFLCAIQYHRMRNGKRIRLKFDYYMLRFTFNKNLMEMRVFHERGAMHVSPEDLANLITDRINESYSRKMLKQVEA